MFFSDKLGRASNSMALAGGGLGVKAKKDMDA